MIWLFYIFIGIIVFLIICVCMVYVSSSRKAKIIQEQIELVIPDSLKDSQDSKDRTSSILLTRLCDNEVFDRSSYRIYAYAFAKAAPKIIYDGEILADFYSNFLNKGRYQRLAPPHELQKYYNMFVKTFRHPEMSKFIQF